MASSVLQDALFITVQGQAVGRQMRLGSGVNPVEFSANPEAGWEHVSVREDRNEIHLVRGTFWLRCSEMEPDAGGIFLAFTAECVSCGKHTECYLEPRDSAYPKTLT
ncbi:hypothetical protein Bbelb_405700 [Branchiostoma belcheri]|nr:hypothetical protein Bbelb_405700 [Branchiostoma belcheri]